LTETFCILKIRPMKRLQSLLPFLCAALMTCQVQGQAIPPIPENVSGAVEGLRAAAPGLMEKAEDKAAEVQERLAPTSKPKTQPKAKDTTQTIQDPAAWGPEDIHKLAVMDLKVGRETYSIMFELFPSDAPQTVSNFISNADSNFYNGLAVHRAIDSYLVQTGDPLTADNEARDKWGTGGQDRLPAEIKRSHKLGAVAMARRNDNVNPQRKSNDSQFYFVLGNMTGLDGQYTVFGQVVAGLDALESISRVPTDSNDAPLERIEIKSLRVVDHKGPLVVVKSTGSTRKFTKPASAKSSLERFLERIW
jgi:cyclophilin family peptidyl-prolyl cis-trans isomerase